MQEMIAHCTAKGLDKAVGNAVAFYASPETGLAFPSNETLMKDWGFSERRIQIALRRLEAGGALRRQPQLETFDRRRVYLVADRQLSLLGEETGAPGAPVSTRAPARLARAGSDVVEPKEPKDPPNPPASGGEPLPACSPGVVAAQGAAVARGRRRRRRAAFRDAHSTASEPCPLQDAFGNVDGALTEAWGVLLPRISEVLGEQNVAVWLHRAHPHRFEGDTLVVGLVPESAGWARDRFGRAIALAADRPVTLVGCELIGRPKGGKQP